MLLAALVEASVEVRASPARNLKIARIALLLSNAGNDLPLAVAYLSATPRQGRIGVGWAAVAAVDSPPAATPTLTLTHVDAILGQIAEQLGQGSSARRDKLVAKLFAAATLDEQAFLRGLLLGELRQGAKEGVVIEAVARATEVKAAAVRRALMLLGDLSTAAQLAAAHGAHGLAALTLQVGRPVRPMLAASAPSVADAMMVTGPAVVEAKLDGMRIQVHRAGDEVKVVTRSLRDVTSGMPAVVAVARSLPGESFVLDGEALALRSSGRPASFQESMSADSSSPGTQAGLQPFFFDCLHLDGRDLLDVPLIDRLTVLDALVPQASRVARLDDPTPADAEAFAEGVLAQGHEGVVVKSLEATYAAGRRGNAWVKVKPSHTLDLVVLAVEWGSGRRQGWLSNLHLGARSGDDFVMLGKTFKGMTDDMLAWQTEQLLALETRRTKHVVHVRPELVVEVAFDGVQDSTRYPGGVALRFARVKRYRPDKSAAEADTIGTIRAIREQQHG